MSKWEIKERDSKTPAPERNAVMGMVMDDRFLAEAAPMFRPDFMTTPSLAKIGRWCVDYFTQYSRAPKYTIQDLYKDYAETAEDDAADIIKYTLAQLSKDWESREGFDTEYHLAATESYFKSRAVLLHANEIKEYVGGGATSADLAELIEGFVLPSRSAMVFEDLLHDPKAWEGLDEEEGEEIFSYPGALGRLIGGFRRGDFKTVVAPEKRGKSWLMLDAAMRGLGARKKVLWVSCGDMPKREVMKRIRWYLSRSDPKGRAPEGFPIPCMDCHHNQIGECKTGKMDQDAVLEKVKGKDKERKEYWKTASYEDNKDHVVCTDCKNEREFKGAHWWKPFASPVVEFSNALEKFVRPRPGADIQIASYPSHSFSPKDLGNLLNDFWRRNKWKPDLLVVDYMDIMAAVNPKFDFRHQENEKWSMMRGISTTWDCGILTGTQGTKATYTKDVIEQGDLSEDKRKLSHVTEAYGLNQNMEEKKAGVMRISCIAARDMDFDVYATVKILQSIKTGRPVLESFF